MKSRKRRRGKRKRRREEERGQGGGEKDKRGDGKMGGSRKGLGRERGNNGHKK